jgi:hypothetical protein
LILIAFSRNSKNMSTNKRKLNFDKKNLRGILHILEKYVKLNLLAVLQKKNQLR